MSTVGSPVVNFARVSIRLRLCGCLLLCINFVFRNLFFNFGLAFNIAIDSFIIGKKCGYLGILVDTNVSRFLLLDFSLDVLSYSCGIAFAFVNPFSMNFCGYPKCVKVSCSSFIRILRAFLLSNIVQSRLARLYGIFFSVYLG